MLGKFNLAFRERRDAYSIIVCITVLLMACQSAPAQNQGVDPFAVQKAKDLGLPPPKLVEPDETVRIEYPTLQADLQMNDEDFKIIAPKILAIEVAFGQVQQFNGPLRRLNDHGKRMNSRGEVVVDPAPKRNNQPPIALALNDLVDVLLDPNTPEEIIKQKLDELHAARAKAWADIKAARDSLRVMVTQRQEAVLVVYGFLN